MIPAILRSEAGYAFGNKWFWQAFGELVLHGRAVKDLYTSLNAK